MSKMTLKQFKAAFNEVADFEIYGWEGILAMIERTYWENAKAGKGLGLDAVYEREAEKANRIHDILENIGYYN